VGTLISYKFANICVRKAKTCDPFTNKATLNHLIGAAKKTINSRENIRKFNKT
jgi:hypothetical protein